MKLRPKTDTIAKRLEWWICTILITITLILTFRSTERIRQLTK